jgi:4-amino-4-deoxy-L-arabinose transferase-like glycosyltransferase
MNTLLNAWGRSQNQRTQEEIWRDRFWQVGLWLAAVTLFSLDLGLLPMDDRENRLIQLAKALYPAPGHHFSQLIPKPEQMSADRHGPFVPALMALTYHWQGFSLGMTRFPGAMLSALAVPLIYAIGREVFSARIPAILSALLFLTFMPVVYEGRLASVNGAVLCFSCLFVVCGLRSRRNLRWSMAFGLSWAMLMLTQSSMALLLGVIIGIFLAWDTPRLLRSLYFWLGSLLGSLPILLWYGMQIGNKDPLFWTNFLLRSFTFAPPDLMFFKMLPFVPGLIFSISGLYWAWHAQNWGWAKLILLWTGVTLAAFVIGGHQAGISLAPYPALALAGGMALGECRNFPSDRPYPRLWLIGLLGYIVATSVIGLSLPWTYPAVIKAWHQYPLIFLILGADLLTLGTVYFLIKNRDPQFISLFFWGIYVCLFLFVISPYWSGIL